MSIAKTRLFSQQIEGTKFTSVKEIVGWMGAIQAQEYAMSKWAVGARLPGSHDKSVETALNQAKIFRTHVLRPTWHLVSADDIYWMVELTGPYIKASLATRHKELGLTEAILAKSNGLIEQALAGGRSLTREELVAELNRAKFDTRDNRASHLLMWSELSGITCSGPIQWGKQSYALLEERAPRPARVGRDEALAKLSRKYFSSHGPATLADFTWWSGLPAGDARQALEQVKAEFTSESYHQKIYYSSNAAAAQPSHGRTVYLLPAYDEIFLSYKDRSAVLPGENMKRVVSSNGIFRPIILVDGQVAGIWKRSVKNELLIVEAELFAPLDRALREQIEGAAARFGEFLQIKEVQTHFGEFTGKTN